ncbi:DUF2019 domain-containing protein [Archangium violaceum]|uniref:DUF2019 domain-containing protein n=1 Tax=Archangium violaceum TaxID=83451 RepID=UPI0019524783|nr:DUF2019 domain-containing protein [Archangium violaceum]QRN97345.1 DUF2019 domain-containing protein [Archangium violaceum]
MKKARLKTLSTENLIEEFRTLSSEHIRAIREGPLGHANRKYETLVAIRGELRERGSEAKHQLLELLTAPDLGTRFWAASSILTFAPHAGERERAEQVLTELAQTQKNSLGFKASMVLEQWKAGTFNPP